MSLNMCKFTQEIVGWSEPHMVYISARYIPGKKKIMADQLSSQNQVIPTELSYLPQVFDNICKVFGYSYIDLSAPR